MRTSGNCVVSSVLAFPTTNEDHALICSWASHVAISSSSDTVMKVRCEQKIDGLGERGWVLMWKWILLRKCILDECGEEQQRREESLWWGSHCIFVVSSWQTLSECSKPSSTGSCNSHYYTPALLTAGSWPWRCFLASGKAGVTCIGS